MAISISQAGTYKEAKNAFISDGGEWIKIQTGGGGGVPPSAPTGVVFAVAGVNEVHVNWYNPVNTTEPPIDHYDIHFAKKPGPNYPSDPTEDEWYKAAETAFIDGTGVYSQHIPNVGTLPGEWLFVSVIAIGPNGAWSSRVPAVDPEQPDPLPSSPTAFIGTWLSEAQNQLAWATPSVIGGLVSYVIEHSLTGTMNAPGEGTVLAEIPYDPLYLGESYIHDKPAGTGNQVNYYMIYGKRADGLTGADTPTSVDVAVPGPPNISAVANSQSQITVSITSAAEVNASGNVRLVYSTAGYVEVTDPNAIVLLDNAPAQAYVHAGLSPSTMYYYTAAKHMTVTNSAGDVFGEYDTAMVGTPDPPPPPPGAPYNMHVYNETWLWWSSFVMFGYQNYQGYPGEYYGGHCCRNAINVDPGLGGTGYTKTWVFNDGYLYGYFTGTSDSGVTIYATVQALGKNGVAHSGTYAIASQYCTNNKTVRSIEDYSQEQWDWYIESLRRIGLTADVPVSLDDVWVDFEALLERPLLDSRTWLAAMTVGGVLMDVMDLSDEAVEEIYAIRDSYSLEGVDAVGQVSRSLGSLRFVNRDPDSAGRLLAQAGQSIGRLWLNEEWPEPDEVEYMERMRQEMD